MTLSSFFRVTLATTVLASAMLLGACASREENASDDTHSVLRKTDDTWAHGEASASYGHSAGH